MDREFFDRLIETFKAEASEYIQNISLKLSEEGLDAPEKILPHIEDIYRQAHSLKGAARAVGLNDIETACQNMENVFSAFKRREKSPDKEIINVLLKMLDGLSDYINASTEKQRLEIVIGLDTDTEKLTAFLLEGSKIKEEESLPYVMPSASPAPPPPPPVKEESAEPKVPETIESSVTEDTATAEPSTAAQIDIFKVPGNRLDMLFKQIQELVFSKLAFESINKELSAASNLVHEFSKNFAEMAQLKLDLLTADSLQGTESPKIVNAIYDRIEQAVSIITELSTRVKRITGEASGNTKKLSADLFRLMEDVKQILLTPFSNRLSIFPKMIRDISRSLGKDISFKMSGAEVEIDKRILDEIKDPLIHLLRNSIDHGIEPPEVRVAAGKPPQGKVELRIVSGEENKIQIIIEDDGRGIDHEKVKAAAVRKHIITPEEAAKLSKRQALDLIFISDVSTAPVITDLSGRGLGMAIVKEKIENLDGEIIVDTTIGKGTTITLSLPVYISTLRGIIVSASGREFAVPTSKVEKVLRISRPEIKTVENRETIIYNGQPITFTELSRLFELPTVAGKAEEYITCLVFSSGGRLSAVGIGEILDETEIILRPFTMPIKKIKNLLGTAVLGNGKLVPVINPQDIAISMEKLTGIYQPDSVSSAKRKGKNILVADDSLTSRMLLKDILESHGYAVRTAVDGSEALSILQGGNFDLLVTDVEMPKLSGFALTSEIRKDARLSALPVILVTSLSRKEDREKGIECGANAYIVKGSFEQSNLLDTIERLI